ncbi:MAG: BON domain-containing protein [Thermoanaerobaculia bacterium]|jgi:osmotically-inducible protein OsmY
MRKLILANSKLFVGLLFALTVIGCGSPAEKERAAPATETTAAVADTAAAVSDTAAATATETTTAPAATDSAAVAAAMTPVTPEAMISEKLVEAFGDDAKTISVALKDGKATLTGKVNERSTQELAEQVALYFPEVKKVENNVTAATERGLGKGKMKDEAADAALESAAKGALAKEIGEYAKDLEVEAADGAVALRGILPDHARHKLATDAMARVKDVRKVVDLIRVK